MERSADRVGVELGELRKALLVAKQEAAALREINAQSGQELLDFSRENTALRERLKLADNQPITYHDDRCDSAKTLGYKPCDCGAAQRHQIKFAAWRRAGQGEPKP